MWHPSRAEGVADSTKHPLIYDQFTKEHKARRPLVRLG